MKVSTDKLVPKYRTTLPCMYKSIQKIAIQPP